MSTPSVVFAAHSTAAGNQLVFDWLIFDGSGVLITDPNLVRSINIFTSTLVVDASAILQTTLIGSELVDSNGNLVNQTTITGYDTTVEYSCRFSAALTDASGIHVSSRVSEAISVVVRGGITNITPTITGSPGDDFVAYTFDTTSAELFSNYMKDPDASGVLQYAEMFATIATNNGSGFVERTFPWADVIANGYTVYIDQSNNVPTEAYGLYLSEQLFIAGVSNPSPGIITFGTNLPNPPVDITTISTFEYNRDNAVDAYSVTDASSVTVLFNNPMVFDPSTNFYTIYRVDLSSNGYTPLGVDASAGTVYVDNSGNYTYGGNTYEYNFVDASAAPGHFYGYQISGTNNNGEGLLSDLIGVRDGQQCQAPVITSAQGIDQAVILTIEGPDEVGGFDLSSNYTILYFDTSNNIPTTFIGQLTAGQITIAGLTNGLTYKFNAYATTTNSNYTTIGTDVSSNNVGPTLIYLSAESNQVTAIPYTTPPAPVSVTALPTFIDNTPPTPDVATGNVIITWVSDSSFSGFPMNYEVYRLDGSSSVLIDTITNPSTQTYLDSGSASVAPRWGSSYTYKVRNFYVVGGNPVYSGYTSSGPVIPFVDPSPPNQTGGVSGTTASFTIVPSSQPYPVNSGGLLPLHYNAVLDVSGTQYFYTDISANVLITRGSLPPNSLVTLTYLAYVIGPKSNGTPGTQEYFSSVVGPITLGTTSAVPVILSAVVDSSGILVVTTNNQGSALTFFEAIVIDSIGTLNLAYATDLNSPPSTITKISNTGSLGVFNVNFNDPNITPATTNILVVVTNVPGADVYDNLS